MAPVESGTSSRITQAWYTHSHPGQLFHCPAFSGKKFLSSKAFRLFWFAEAQQEMLPGKEFTFMSTHLFRKDDPDKQWKATETLHYPSEPKTKGNSWYEVTHKTNKDAAVYGKVTFDMKKLEERKEELPTRGTEECLCYVVNLRVYVTMLEGFRHELRFRVKWIRGEVIEDDVEGDTEEPMEIDGAEDVFVDVAPAFDLNAV